jgi:hypothetical protein
LAVAECWYARMIEEALAREAHMLVTKPKPGVMKIIRKAMILSLTWALISQLHLT